MVRLIDIEGDTRRRSWLTISQLESIFAFILEVIKLDKEMIIQIAVYGYYRRTLCRVKMGDWGGYYR